ncbi:GGDEF domain-containing protein [Pseudonocardia sp. CA-107938]|uniref:GGDEF domain-containing protein n=1 Tax=Pseudonocardia sp. CA-107938 TaxID=3240021 RepID=UPI003D902E58
MALHDDRIRALIRATRDAADPQRALHAVRAALHELARRPADRDADPAWNDRRYDGLGVLSTAIDAHLAAARRDPGNDAYLAALQAELHQDALTGLGNRRALNHHLSQSSTWTTAPCVVAMIDLDRFKAVNDQRSHAAGDAVLITVAHTVNSSLRTKPPGRDILTRFGGDEFVAILPNTTLPPAVQALRRAVAAVHALPTNTGGGVTLSVGAAAVQPDGDAAAALDTADRAMYAAKRLGDNTVMSAPTPEIR